MNKFKISLGFEPIGTKIKKGDGKTPEGLYYIEDKIRESSFFLALKVSYPNPWDIRRALELNHHPGGQIMIHGVPNIGYDRNLSDEMKLWILSWDVFIYSTDYRNCFSNALHTSR